MNKSTKYSPEFRERAVRMAFEHQGEHVSQWAATREDAELAFDQIQLCDLDTCPSKIEVA